MISCPCLCTGADSTYGIDSSPGIDSTLEPIPCHSDSSSFSVIPVMIPVPEKNGIITPLDSRQLWFVEKHRGRITQACGFLKVLEFFTVSRRE